MSKKIQILIITLLTFLAYANIFGNGLVIDDRYFIREWPLTRSWGSIGQLLVGVNPNSQPGVYRPIRSLLYLFYYQAWGTSLVGYHLHSLAVHLSTTVLVYLIIMKISPKAAFASGLLFALHPIHTESITYIAASMEMVGVVFFMVAIYTYLQEKRYWTWMWAGLAFFTYEMTLTLPLLLLLYEWTLGKINWRKVLPVAIITGIYLFVRIGVLHINPARGDYLAYSFYHTQLTMTKMWVKYLWMLVWPVNLSHNQTVVPGFEAFMTPYSDQQAILSQSILDPMILGAIGVIGGIGVIGWKLRKKMPVVSFSIGWFFVSLLPVAYFFPQGTAFAEKYLYIASFGFVLLLGWGLEKLGKIGMIGVVIISLFYGLRTYLRNRYWQSPRTLWEYEVQIHPRSELAFYNLGIIYAESGEKDKAIVSYKKVLELKPQFWQAKHNLDNLLK